MTPLVLPAALLGAGEGKRVGGPKVLMPLGPRTVLEHVVRGCASAGFNPLVVVAPPHLTGDVRARCPEAGPVIPNPAPETGPLGSLHLAMRSLPPGAPGVLMTLVDFALVRPETYAALAHSIAADPTRLWRPVKGGRHGHPVWFPSSLFDDLMNAPVNRGARAVVYARENLWGSVEVDDPWIHRDMDTPPDVEEFRREAEARP